MLIPPQRATRRSDRRSTPRRRDVWPGIRLPAPAAGHTGRVPDALCPVVVGRDAETSALQSASAAARGGDTLSRAVRLLDDPDARAEADTLLVEALGLAGRVDEAMVAGERLITQLGQGGAAATTRAEIHLRLAHAAVDGTRWEAAAVHLDAAKDMLAANPQPALSAAYGYRACRRAGDQKGTGRGLRRLPPAASRQPPA